MIADCGCEVTQHPYHNPGRVEIIHCPMHKAASKMLEALEEAVSQAPWMHFARLAIAQARGQE
jgi:hypothetical protein